jgi:D-glycero-D-manno-heptose 1,7-bisphosphate phosphatase
VATPERFIWIPGATALIRRANDAGWYVFVVTNQAGVAHGLYDEKKVRALHLWMSAQIRPQGASIDDYRYCPFHPEAAIDEYRKNHPWRKPNPGMLIDLMAVWPIDQRRSFLIGDRQSDLAAATAAGLKSRLFTGGDISAEMGHLINSIH